jgi:DUF1680 family protein
MEEALIMEVWDTFREYIPEKNKDTAAAQYIDFLLGKDVEIAVIEGLSGYDPHLDDAIKNVVDEANSFEEEDDSGYYEDEEDY